MSEYADYVVLRHGPDIPEEYWSPRHEGLWMDRRGIRRAAPTGPLAASTGMAIAEPTNRFEIRDDGAVAEVWEIRLATPNERRR